jgi:hypothetical protein
VGAFVGAVLFNYWQSRLLEKKHSAKLEKGGVTCAEEVLEDVTEVREVDEMEDRKEEIFEAASY